MSGLKIQLSEEESLCESSQQEIKSLFLSMTMAERQGYFIPLPKLLQWAKAFTENMTKKEKDKMIENVYLRDYLKNPEYNFEAYNLFKMLPDPENPKRHIPVLNDDGMKYFCMVSHYPKSVAVRLYYTQLEDDYLEALQKSRPENQKTFDTLMKLKDDFLTYKKDLWYWQGEELMAQNQLKYYNNKVLELEAELSAVDFANQLSQAKLNNLKEKKKETKEYLASIGNEYMEFKALQKQFLKPIYAVLVNPKEVNIKLTAQSPSPQTAKKPYKMEKYMPREKVIEMGLTTESEDEMDLQEKREDNIWTSGITYDISDKPLKSQIRYYKICEIKPSGYSKTFYIPKYKAPSKSKKKPATESNISQEKESNESTSDVKKTRKTIKKTPSISSNYLERLKEFLNSKKEYYTPISNIWKTNLSTISDFLTNLFIKENITPEIKLLAERQYNSRMSY
jgi:hypothetical protein